MFAALGSTAWVLISRYFAHSREQASESDAAWGEVRAAWKLRA
jgi:hypothetical protein